MRRLSLVLILLLAFAPTVAQNESDLPEGEIVFVSRNNGNNEIYMMNSDGSNLRNLTNNPADDYYPRWSPDGLNIAFVSTREGRRHIYIMDMQRFEVTQLTDGWFEANPRWSHDGQHIYYWQEIGMPTTSNLEVFMMDRNGDNKQNITANEAWDSSIIISPDGNQALFFSSRNNPYEELFLMDLITYDVVDLAVPHDAALPVWTPDGNGFIYTASIDSGDEIFMYDLQTNEVTNLSNYPDGDYFEEWLPNSQMLFRSYRSGKRELYTMNYDGSDVETVLTGIEILNVASLPDGQYLLYGEEAVYVWDVISNQIEILSRPAETIPPHDAQWRPEPTENN